MNNEFNYNYFIFLKTLSIFNALLINKIKMMILNIKPFKQYRWQK